MDLLKVNGQVKACVATANTILRNCCNFDSVMECHDEVLVNALHPRGLSAIQTALTKTAGF